MNALASTCLRSPGITGRKHRVDFAFEKAYVGLGSLLLISLLSLNVTDERGYCFSYGTFAQPVAMRIVILLSVSALTDRPGCRMRKVIVLFPS